MSLRARPVGTGFSLVQPLPGEPAEVSRADRPRKAGGSAGKPGQPNPFEFNHVTHRLGHPLDSVVVLQRFDPLVERIRAKYAEWAPRGTATPADCFTRAALSRLG